MFVDSVVTSVHTSLVLRFLMVFEVVISPVKTLLPNRASIAAQIMPGIT